MCQQEEILEKWKYCQLCPQSSVSLYICKIFAKLNLGHYSINILIVLRIPDKVPTVENNCLPPFSAEEEELMLSILLFQYTAIRPQCKPFIVYTLFQKETTYCRYQLFYLSPAVQKVDVQHLSC